MRSSWFWCLRCNRCFDGPVAENYDAGGEHVSEVGQMYLDAKGETGWRCPYDGCGTDLDNVIDWLLVKEQHPEYPDVPEKGKVYRIEANEE